MLMKAFMSSFTFDADDMNKLVIRRCVMKVLHAHASLFSIDLLHHSLYKPKKDIVVLEFTAKGHLRKAHKRRSIIGILHRNISNFKSVTHATTVEGYAHPR